MSTSYLDQFKEDMAPSQGPSAWVKIPSAYTTVQKPVLILRLLPSFSEDPAAPPYVKEFTHRLAHPNFENKKYPVKCAGKGCRGCTVSKARVQYTFYAIDSVTLTLVKYTASYHTAKQILQIDDTHHQSTGKGIFDLIDGSWITVTRVEEAGQDGRMYYNDQIELEDSSALTDAIVGPAMAKIKLKPLSENLIPYTHEEIKDIVDGKPLARFAKRTEPSNGGSPEPKKQSAADRIKNEEE
jgi:hypothetical protein